MDGLAGDVTAARQDKREDHVGELVDSAVADKRRLGGEVRPLRQPRGLAAGDPWTVTCAPVSVSGFSRTGFTEGGAPAALACSIWARPISPPSAVAPALFDMFCGLNGATRMPRPAKARQSPATASDLPTCEPVPWIMMAGVRVTEPV